VSALTAAIVGLALLSPATSGAQTGVTVTNLTGTVPGGDLSQYNNTYHASNGTLVGGVAGAVVWIVLLVVWLRLGRGAQWIHRTLAARPERQTRYEMIVIGVVSGLVVTGIGALIGH
jgi:hypothetical protein